MESLVAEEVSADSESRRREREEMVVSRYGGLEGWWGRVGGARTLVRMSWSWVSVSSSSAEGLAGGEVVKAEYRWKRFSV